jgi:predicted transcriptional regulator
MVRRSTLEITIKVLETLQNGEFKPSRIMHDANISWDKLNEILDFLIKLELVTPFETKKNRRKMDKRSKIGYRITNKGQNVLRRFHKKDSDEIKEFNLFYQNRS